MMFKHKLLALAVIAVLFGMSSNVQAVSFDFEAPDYSPGVLVGNGWDVKVGGTSQPGGYSLVTIATAHPYDGSQYVDFGSSGSFLDAAHSVDTISSGIAVIEYANYYAGPGDSSGKLMATNAAAGDTLIGVGVDDTGGANWLVAHGAGGTNRIYGKAVPDGQQWFLIRIELDLDNDTADVMWRQTTAYPWTTVMTDYATNDLALDGIRLEGRKAAVGFDHIYVGDIGDQPEPPPPAAPRYTFMQFSDVHVGDDDNEPVHNRLLAAIDLANTLNPDFVIATGDISQHPVNGIPGATDEILKYKNYISALNMPIYTAPGNHDISYFNADADPRGIAWGDYDTLTAFFEANIGPLNQSFSHKGGRFIVINNVGEYSRMPSYLFPDQLTWIESEMQDAEQNCEDIFVFGHISPIATNGTDDPWGASGLALINLCNQYNADLVTFGHGHILFETVLDDVVYIEALDMSVPGHETVYQYRIYKDYFELWSYNVFDAESGTLVRAYNMNDPKPVMGNINDDQSVDLTDVASLALEWLEGGCGACACADLTDDGNVDLNDLVELAAHWMTVI